jgi:hypothetical protein
MRDCGDCGAKPGEFHQYGCDVEHCAICGGQCISCGCVYEINGMPMSTLEEEHPEIYTGGATDEMYEVLDAEVERLGGRLPWTGEFPGCAECREFDLWSYWGPPWISCHRDHPQASEDLNRLCSVAMWDKTRRRYVVRN